MRYSSSRDKRSRSRSKDRNRRRSGHASAKRRRSGGCRICEEVKRDRCSCHSRSRSRSFSPSARRSRSRSPRRRRRSRSSSRGRGGIFRGGRREQPDPSRCLGVFGLSLYTSDRDLRDFFGNYGPVTDVQLIHDYQTGRSRGFGFVYFENIEDAVKAHDRAAGDELDGHKIRIDYSVTKRAHSPTPGVYMGQP